MTNFGKLAILLGLAAANPAAAWAMQAAPANGASMNADAPAKPPCDSSAPCKVDAGDAAADDQADPALAAEPAEKAIDAPFGNAWLGAADGDVTIVLFVDYACPACREAQTTIDALLASDKKVKVVYRILVNEDEGREAAMASLAVAQSHADWGRFHRALDAAGAPTKATIAAALTAVGEDPAKLPSSTDPDMAGLALADELIHNDNEIVDRKGKSVPSWLIGSENAHGGVSLDDLQAGIARARQEKAGAH